MIVPVALHDTVAVPEPVRLVGVIAPQFRPPDGVSVRLTTPAKPLMAVTVNVEVADVPALTVRLVGVVLIVKSWTLYVTATE